MADNWEVVGEVPLNDGYEPVGEVPLLPPLKRRMGRGNSYQAPALRPQPESVLQNNPAFEQAPTPSANALALANALSRRENAGLVDSPMYGAGVQALYGENAVPRAVQRQQVTNVLQKQNKDRIAAVREQTDAAFSENPIAQALAAPGRRLLSGAASVVGGVAGIPQMFGSDVGRETADAARLMAAANMPADPGIADEILAGFGQLGPMIGGAGAVRAGLAPFLGASRATGVATTLSGGAGGALTGGQVLSDLEFRSDLTEDEKQRRALASSLFSAITGKVADRFLLPGATGGSMPGVIAKAFGAESLQEGSDTMVQNFATDKPLMEGVPRAALVGGIVGGGVKAIGEVNSDAYQLAKAMDADANAFADAPVPRNVWAPTEPVVAPAAAPIAAPAAQQWVPVAEVPLPQGATDAPPAQPQAGAQAPVAGTPQQPDAAPADAGAAAPVQTAGVVNADPDATRTVESRAPAAPAPAPVDPVPAPASPAPAVAAAPVPPVGARPADVVPEPAAELTPAPAQPAPAVNLTTPASRQTPGAGTDPTPAPDTSGFGVRPNPVRAPTAEPAPAAAPAAPKGEGSARVRQAVTKRYGKSVERLERAGVLKIWDSADQFAEETGQRSTNMRGAQGMYQGGVAHLFADGIEPGQEVPVLLHESGEHAGMKQMLGERKYGELLQRAYDLLDQGDAAAGKARQRIPQDTKQHHVDSEMLAYMIEEGAAARAGQSPGMRKWMADMVAAIRAWAYETGFAKHLKRVGVDLQLTPQDIVALADRAIKWQAKQVDRTAADGESEAMLSRQAGRKEQAGDYEVFTQKDGSLVVPGDADAIRALIPEGITGRATAGGLAFTPSDAPRVRSALAGERIAYGREGRVIQQLPMKDGKYVGAPAKYNTPGKIPTLRKLLRRLADEGAPGRYWYENSSRAVLKMTGGDVQEARKFVALLAIYSPQAKVDANSTFALRAWAQYKAGQPISVKTGVMDSKAQAALDDVDAFWSGEKTGNFFFNLLSEIDPSTKGRQGATIDMWMMRAGQYDNDAPTSTQYAFMENETNRLAQELGWEPQQVQAAIWVAMKARMENKGVKQRTEARSEKKGWIRFDYPLKNGKPFKTRVILDAQAHRDNWLNEAFALDVAAEDTQAAKFDFADGVRRHIGQVSWEPRPGRATGLLPGIHDAPYDQQVEFQQAVQRALYDADGNDLLAMHLGLLEDGATAAPGVWQSEVSAGVQTNMPMAPAKGDDGKSKIDPAQKKLLDVYAATLGVLLRQDGVGYHRPFYTTNRSAQNGVELRIGQPFTPEQAKALNDAVDRLMQERGVSDWSNGAALISSPDGMRAVNFGALKDNGDFRELVLEAAEDLPGDLTVEPVAFASDGNVVSNDWKDSPNGEGYADQIRDAGRPDVLDWASSVLGPRVQKVFDEFAERNDWGNPGQLAGGDRGPRYSRRSTAPLAGAPTVQGASGPDPKIVAVAEQYARDIGIPHGRQARYAEVDPDRARRIAAAYEAMPHAPNDPKVREAYRNLIRQTVAQYRALEQAGYRFYLFDESNDPYQGNPWNAMRDLRANQSMGVFATEAGFGSGEVDPDNQMLADTGITWPYGSLDGEPKRVLANDLFRAVHDAFGHGLEGAGFREQGEENAWQAHARLFTGSAIGAITSETRGQNSWLNYGPHGETNRTAKVEDTIFADQKTGLMPEWTWTEGVVPLEGEEDAPQFSRRTIQVDGTRRPIEDSKGRLVGRTFQEQTNFWKWAGDTLVVDDEGRPLVMYHGTSKDRDFSSFAVGARGAWFTSDPGMASEYAEENDSKGLKYNPDTRGYDEVNSAARVLPVYLRITNPYTLTNEDKFRVNNANYAKRQRELFAEIRAKGHDGILWNNNLTKEWVALGGPEQIKSATGNNGDFDASNPDIRFSRAPSRSGGSRQRANTLASTWSVDAPNTWDAIVRSMQDNKVDLKRVTAAIEQSLGRRLPDDQDAYLGEELYHGKVGERVARLHEDRVMPILRKIAVAQKQSKVTLDDVNQYLHALHAPEANKHLQSINPGPGNDALSGMSNAEAAAAIASLRAAGKEPALKVIAKDVHRLLADTRTDLVADGLEEAGTVQAWEAAYKQYVPLHRDIDTTSPGKGQGFAVKGPEAKRRTGSNRAVVDILANVVDQAEKAAIRAEKAEVGRTLLAMAQAHPNPDFWTVDTPKAVTRIDPRTGLVVRTSQGYNGSEPNVIPVKQYGVTRYVVFNERNERAMEVAKAMRNLEVAPLNKVVQLAGKGTRFMASLLTQRNPEFWLTNFARDLQAVGIQMNGTDAEGLQAAAAKNLVPALRGMRELARGNGTGLWARRAAAMKAAGGATGYMQSFADSTERMGSLQREVDRMNQGKADPRKVARAVLDFIDDYNDVIENGVRLSVFQAAIDAGISEARAASLAKNITVNFNRKGNLSPGINSLYMFFNAGIQGNARMAAALASSGKVQAIVGGIAVSGFVLDVVNRALAGDDDESKRNRYDMLPQHLKSRNWVFFTGEGDDYITVPMPLGYHLFHNAGRLMADAMMRKDPRNASEYGWAAAGLVFDTFSPLGGFSSVGQFLAPSLLDPAVQLAENKNFMGGPVYASGKRDDKVVDAYPAYTRFFDTTPDLWKRASKALNDLTGGDNVKPGAIDIEPDIFRHVWGALTGGPGRTLDRVIDTTQAKARGEEISPARVPILSRFYGEVGDRQREAVFYEEQKRVATAETQFKHFTKQGRRDLALEVLKDLGDGDEARGRRLIAQFKAGGKDVASVNKRLRELRRDTIPDEEQRGAIDELRKKRTQARIRVVGNTARDDDDE